MATAKKSAEELAEEAAEMEKAVESYEKLVCACDGAEGEALTEYDATTFMAMLDDHRYRAKVRAAHQAKYG